MAMLASVTVSIAEETNGVFMVICLVSAEVRSWTKEIVGTFQKHFQQNSQSLPLEFKYDGLL